MSKFFQRLSNGFLIKIDLLLRVLQIFAVLWVAYELHSFNGVARKVETDVNDLQISALNEIESSLQEIKSELEDLNTHFNR